MKLLLVALIVLAVVLPPARAEEKADKKEDTRVYELRVYHAAPGKMDALNARFRDHTCKLFEKHGMKIVAFWQPTDPKEHDAKLIYVLVFPSREAATKSWKAFQEDPEWQKAKAESEKEGKLVDKVDSTYMKATDYSPLK